MKYPPVWGLVCKFPYQVQQNVGSHRHFETDLCVGCFPFDPPHLVFTLFPRPGLVPPRGINELLRPLASGWVGHWKALVRNEELGRLYNLFLPSVPPLLTHRGWLASSLSYVYSSGSQKHTSFHPFRPGALRAPAPHGSYLSLLNESRDRTLLPVFPQHLKLSRMKQILSKYVKKMKKLATNQEKIVTKPIFYKQCLGYIKNSYNSVIKDNSKLGTCKETRSKRCSV